MLEFFHIMEDYNSVHEAALSFDSQKGELNLVNNHSESNVNQDLPESGKVFDEFEFNENGNTPKNQKSKHTEIIDFVPGTFQNTNSVENRNEDFLPLNLEDNAKLYELPIYEKVKRIVAQNPLIGAWGIRKILRHEHFGYTRINIFKLRRLLKELDLNTKKKRFR